jgi:tripartite ATP-independent transporter DctM subunit
MITIAVVFLLFAMLAVGAPVGFAMLVSGVLGLYWIGGWDATMAVLSTTPRSVGSVFEFLTIPMFLLMAEFVLRSGIADDLFNAAAAWFGRIRGGLGIATALAGAGFGAICGSSTAAAATLSSASMPAMLKHGYKMDMAAGVVAISGTLSMLIPPSVAMIIYGLLADVSIAKMLIAGVVPGVIVSLAIAVTVYLLAWIDPTRAPLAEKVSFRTRLSLLGSVGPMLLLMAAVTGSIYTGVATPTESSALGALVAGVLYFWRRRRSALEVHEVFARATSNACMIGVIILGANLFSTFFALTQTTQIIISWVGSLDVPTTFILVGLVLVYIVLGCFMDQMAILVLTVPVIAPLLTSLHVDLVWFGVIVIVTAELGMVTPPFGLNVFVVSKYSNTPVGIAFRGTVPHVVAHLIVIAVFMSFPALVLWLPNHVQ